MPMYRLSEDRRSHFKEYEVIYLGAEDLDHAMKLIAAHPDFVVLGGSTDVAVKIKKQSSMAGMIDIASLQELHVIETASDTIHIGALATITDILENSAICTHLPILIAAAEQFASRQIRNLATLGGNIANASPAADLVAPLLVLNATVTLGSQEGKRVMALKDLFCGYKCTKLEHELILEITIPLVNHAWYYRKTGVRERLNITKVGLAAIKTSEGYYRVSGTSLNPYASRFGHVENMLNSGDVDDGKLIEALQLDISPSGSLRSTKAYRSQVAFNMLKEALSKLAE